ncbi:MAG TPA: transporter substrate-binding domain-containing protein, partial [Actinotalea sp.]|nr:transporter substrate-binding domain-containing protein [Actinotalea sp.]
MTARRLFTATALALTAALAVSACSSDSGDDQSAEPSAPPAESDTSLTDVQEAGVLVVGTEGTYRPFSFHEDGSGDLTGYDVEVIRAVAEELGVEVRFEETQWDAIFAGLEAG